MPILSNPKRLPSECSTIIKPAKNVAKAVPRERIAFINPIKVPLSSELTISETIVIRGIILPETVIMNMAEINKNIEKGITPA